GTRRAAQPSLQWHSTGPVPSHVVYQPNHGRVFMSEEKMNPLYDRRRNLKRAQNTFATTHCSGMLSRTLLALIKVVPIRARMSRYDTAKTARWSERVRAWACAICVALASPVVCAVGAAGDVKD